MTNWQNEIESQRRIDKEDARTDAMFTWVFRFVMFMAVVSVLLMWWKP